MILWFVVFFVNGVHSLPDGAPQSACSTLMPRHAGIKAQTTQVPWIIEAELSNDKAVVHISSTDGETFEGSVLQARSSKDPSKFIDGEFTVSQFSKTINCNGSDQNTLTHVNRNPKSEMMTEWTPKGNITEEVIFRATIAKKFDIFWTEVDSNPLKLTNYSESMPEDVETEMIYEKCFKEEGCVGLGSSTDPCVERKDCEVLLRYSKSTDGIKFILQGNLEANSTNYMAVGWSMDAVMGDDSVRECINDGYTVTARDSWNEGKSNTRTKAIASERYSFSFLDGFTSCSWTTPFVTEMNGRTYDFLNNKFHILLATGKVTEWRLRYHNKRMASLKPLNLTQVNIPNPTEEDSSHDTGVQHLPSSSTGQKEESTSDIIETTTPSSSSSIKISFIFIFTGLIFATKESINYNIFEYLFQLICWS